jgi:hypothetical protein
MMKLRDKGAKKGEKSSEKKAQVAGLPENKVPNTNVRMPKNISLPSA